MKKLIFLFAMVFAISMAMAQSNFSTVTQTGNNHKADVTQFGSLNKAKITQENGNGNRLGAPLLTDPGVNVGGEVDDLSKAKGLVQEGNENVANITQQGSNNAIQQFREIKDVFNSVYQKGDGNNIVIKQVGNSNVLGQDIYEYNSIGQYGEDNVANILQNGGENKLYKFHQSGDGNNADIDQIGYRNKIKAASQSPIGGVASSRLKIMQDGNDNEITGAGEEGSNIKGDIFQDGNSNRAFMNLSRTDTYGDIDQIGNDNKATLTINKSFIGDGNWGKIYQDGNSNEANIMVGQNDPLTTSADNTMQIEQDGSFNNAEIFVEGSLNVAKIFQTAGNSNVASVSSIGNSNVGLIYQTGSSNVASVTQSGIIIQP